MSQYQNGESAPRLNAPQARRLIAAILLPWLLLSMSPPASAVDLVGYLPYYRMNATYNANILPGQLALLDEVRYFGLTAASDGAVVPQEGSGDNATHISRIETIQQIISTLPEGQRPRLNITLGGAGEDATFTTIAASSSLRTAFAQNIKTLLDDTDVASVDIDWEHPDAGVQRTTHYPAMLARIKQEIGADRSVSATVDPTVMIPSSVFSGVNAIDGISLMTYDLGWWGNDPANPNSGEHSLPEYVLDAVEAWTEPAGSGNDRPWVFGTWGNAAPEEKLSVGLPFYAHKVVGGDSGYTYAQLVASGTTNDGNYYTFDGQNVWLPGPDLVRQRVEYAHDQHLKSIIIWEIGQDLHPDDPDSLLRAAYDAKQSLAPILGDYDGNGEVDLTDYNLWKSTFNSNSDRRADGNNDGIVDAADYTIWRDSYLPQGGMATNLAVPEPSAMALAIFACATAMIAIAFNRNIARRLHSRLIA